MTRRLGQTVIVDNRPGEAGISGTAAVRTAAPDGYIIIYANAASHAQATAMRRDVPYAPVTDFAPVVSRSCRPSPSLGRRQHPCGNSR